MTAECESSSSLTRVLDVSSSMRGRARVFALLQVPFAGATVVVWGAAYVVRPSSAADLLLTAGLVLMLIATASGLLPWERWPASVLITVPIVDLIAVACLRAALLPDVPAVEVLIVFPVLWLAGAYPRAISAIAVGAMAAVFLPWVLTGGGTRAVEGLLLSIPSALVALGIGILVKATVMRWERATRVIEEQGEQLSAALRAARLEASLSETMLETVDVGVAFFDADGTIRKFNTIGRDMALRAGLPAFDVGFESTRAWNSSRTERLPPNAQVIFRALRGEHVRGQLSWIGEPGDQIAILLSASPVKTGEEKVGTIVIAHDVTDLVEAISVREEFLATVSHELKTPLTSIIGYIDLIDLAVSAGRPVAVEHLGTVVRNAEELLRRVSDLLSVADTNVVSRVSTPANEVLAEARAKMAPLARQKNISISATAAPDTTALLDRDRMRQVIDNLIHNAIKYSPEGTHITLTAERRENDVALLVADEGYGMSPEEARQAMTKFYRAPGARERVIPGMGMGLAIVERIVAAHNGRILIDSTPGRGTTMTVLIPHATPTDDENFSSFPASDEVLNRKEA